MATSRLAVSELSGIPAYPGGHLELAPERAVVDFLSRKFLPLFALFAVLAADCASARSWPSDDSRDIFSRRYRGDDEVRDDHRGHGGGGGEHSDSQSGSSSGSGHQGGTNGGSQSTSGKGGGSAVGEPDDDDRFGKK